MKEQTENTYLAIALYKGVYLPNKHRPNTDLHFKIEKLASCIMLIYLLT